MSQHDDYQVGDLITGPDGAQAIVTERILFDDGTLCYYRTKGATTLGAILEEFK